MDPVAEEQRLVGNRGGIALRDRRAGGQRRRRDAGGLAYLRIHPPAAKGVANVDELTSGQTDEETSCRSRGDPSLRVSLGRCDRP